ncbi:hypothetical protein T484DRAFT_1892855 [Baffinella frigidus]|nr:hypothetical protein T484DRAFT_1892855 [Cryptophyta sp. CCMP2293]
MATVPKMGAREVANVVHSLTPPISVDAELVGELVDRATATAGDFKPQAVSNLVWGLAKMGIQPDAGLPEAMQGRATAQTEGWVERVVGMEDVFGAGCPGGEKGRLLSALADNCAGVLYPIVMS